MKGSNYSWITAVIHEIRAASASSVIRGNPPQSLGPHGTPRRSLLDRRNDLLSAPLKAQLSHCLINKLLLPPNSVVRFDPLDQPHLGVSRKSGWLRKELLGTESANHESHADDLASCAVQARGLTHLARARVFVRDTPRNCV
jgi:hypothetical protein